MAGPWVTYTELAQEVADILKVDVGNLEAYWTRLATRCLFDGYQDIAAILAGKGYTIGQMDAWDSRKTYNRDQSLFWILVRGVGLGNYDDKDRNKLDRREELRKSVTILINGAPASPGAESDVGGVGGGVISEEGYRIDSDTEF